MLALRRLHTDAATRPFRTAEQAWIWTMATLLARRDGAVHVRILRIWGERQRAPQANRLLQRSDWRLWHQAIGQLEWSLRARGVVR